MAAGARKGGWAEDFPEPPGLLARYPKLAETPLADPAQRTEWNVRDADACMIVVDAGGLDVSAGTALAQELAHRYRKPLLIVEPGRSRIRSTARRCGCACSEARHGDGFKLAIGGPRESEAPGIYARAAAFIRLLARLALA